MARDYLHGRGITDEVIARYGIDGDGEKIIIPVKGFNKYRRFPQKAYFYDKGFKAALFGIPQVTKPWCVLTEGELDALRLASVGIPAVSSTGGANSWNDEWLSELPQLVFICHDTDKAGKDGALKIHWKIPGSRIIELPEGKDVTEYLQNHTKEDFELLIKNSVRVPKPIQPPIFRSERPRVNGTEVEKARSYPISNLIRFQQNKAKCIWHTEKSASLVLYPDNHVYCFGCNKAGSAIHVIMQLENLTFKEAIIRLNSMV